MDNFLNNKYIISEFHGIEVDKNLIKEAIETNSTISIKCILQKADTVNRNGRVYPFKILKREVDKYQALVDERSAMGECDHPDCQSPDTQILTQDGWKFLPEISDTEKIYTLNVLTNKIELQQIEKKIDQPYNGLMYHIYNRFIDQLVTPNHRFLIEDKKGNKFYKTAQELFEYRSSDWKIPKKGLWDGIKNEYYTIPSFSGFDNSPKNKIKEWSNDINIKSEDWFAFLGLYLAEGSVVGGKTYDYRKDRKYEVKITQAQEEKNKKIIELFNKLPFKNKRIRKYKNSEKTDFIITDIRLHQYLLKLGNSQTKYIPQDIKQSSPELLSILLEWFHFGDGRVRYMRKGKSVAKEVFSVSKRLIEDLHEILLKSGGHGNITTEIPVDRYINDITFIEKEIENNDGTISLIKEKVIKPRLIKAENSKLKYYLHFSTTDYINLSKNFFHIEKVLNYNDRVYCVRVPNGNFYTMRNGKSHWVGNSAVISLSNVSHIVTEMHWEGNTLYGTIEIAETPAGNILKGLLKSGIKLGISSRGVGSVKSVNGNDVVQDDFELLAFDVVSSPSTPGAYLFKEGRQWGLTKLTAEGSKIIKTEDKNKNEEIIINLSKEDFWN